MIGFLKGKILSLTPECALIETASGIGFEVNCSGSAFSSLAGKTEGELYTYLQVSENGTALYGFSSPDEKNMFLKLISVSGVGPKMGIAVLSGLSSGELAAAIATSDVKRLSAVKGLGKKTAERIILELREKVSLNAAASENGVLLPEISSGDEDAVVALMTLGFSRSESEKAIARARANGAATVEDIIMLALKGM
ncbi:MAG: Holliday junction branch migration protein RuvA [Clostridia bacterium]|nr:Holliday junction branch migration protein RuvA [Clostridia bacterium]